MQEYNVNRDKNKHEDLFIYSGEEMPFTGKLYDDNGNDVDFKEDCLLQMIIRDMRGFVYKEYSSKPLSRQEPITINGNTFSCRLKRELTRKMVGHFIVEVKLVQDGNTYINVCEPILVKNDFIKRTREEEIVLNNGDEDN